MQYCLLDQGEETEFILEKQESELLPAWELEVGRKIHSLFWNSLWTQSIIHPRTTTKGNIYLFTEPFWERSCSVGLKNSAILSSSRLNPLFKHVLKTVLKSGLKKKKSGLIPGIYFSKLENPASIQCYICPSHNGRCMTQTKAISIATSRKTSSPVTPQQTNQQATLYPKVTKIQINLKHSSLLFLTKW